jgi:hypothetical protein
VSCTVNGMHTNVLACFGGSPGTELELTNGQEYGLYKVYQLLSLGTETQQGFRINLRRNFKIVAQNSSSSLILGIKIMDTISDQIVWQKQVSRFGVVNVSN